MVAAGGERWCVEVGGGDLQIGAAGSLQTARRPGTAERRADGVAAGDGAARADRGWSSGGADGNQGWGVPTRRDGAEARMSAGDGQRHHVFSEGNDRRGRRDQGFLYLYF